MRPTQIPDWDSRGVLPPFQGEAAANPVFYSPYQVKAMDLVQRFGTSSARLNILEGLLSYREALQSVGVISGFQWVNGSFVENVEELKSRDPNDVDVVTFFYLPHGESQQSLAEQALSLFRPKQVKEQYGVDAYPFLLDEESCPALLRRALYWYGLWAHRRDLTWKGFVEIPLASCGEEVWDRIAELRSALEGE